MSRGPSVCIPVMVSIGWQGCELVLTCSACELSWFFGHHCIICCCFLCFVCILLAFVLALFPLIFKVHYCSENVYAVSQFFREYTDWVGSTSACFGLCSRAHKWHRVCFTWHSGCCAASMVHFLGMECILECVFVQRSEQKDGRCEVGIIFQ